MLTVDLAVAMSKDGSVNGEFDWTCPEVYIRSFFIVFNCF